MSTRGHQAGGKLVDFIIILDMHLGRQYRMLALFRYQYCSRFLRKKTTYNTSTRMHSGRLQPATLTLVGKMLT